MKKDLKVAIVCDWLTGIGGAERVVLELHKLFPSAPIYTSQYDPESIDWFEGADVHTLWLQHLPKSLKKFLPPLRAIAFRRLDLSSYDLVISSSGAEAKAVKTGKNTIHISYCHAPTHYYWMRYNEYLKNPGFGKLDWLARISLKILVGPLRWLDYRAAQKPNYLIANSTFTKSQIKKYYARDSEVIYPPVDIERFKNSVNQSEKKGFVVLGRQTPYKKIDLAVAAATKLNVPLTVIGNGPDHQKLVDIAGPSIEFITNASEKDVVTHISSAKTFIFPGIDDFGIAPVEALAAGTTVIAYKDGGVIDYITEGVNGLFFNEQTVSSLSEVMEASIHKEFDPQKVIQSAHKFNTQGFKNSVTSFIAKI
ncbi:MAG TPA: glycosyltransferase [Candidatus Saccharimonadales bacterium]